MKNTKQVKVMNTIEYNEMARDARRVLEHEREEMADRLQQVNNFLQLMEHADALASKVERPTIFAPLSLLTILCHNKPPYRCASSPIIIYVRPPTE